MDEDDALLALLDACDQEPGKRGPDRAGPPTKGPSLPGAAAAAPAAGPRPAAVPARAPKHYVETLTGIKVKMPKVSGVVFKEQVAAATYVPLDRASNYAGGGTWLTVGVLVRKEFAAGAGGQAYSRWQLADLRGGELRAVLFGDAHSERKLTPEGTVVALVNGATSREYSSLSITSAAQVQLLAESAGFAFCQGITKAGARCSRAVDKTVSSHCEFHALQQQAALRRELRRPGAGGAAAGGGGGRGLGDGSSGGYAAAARGARNMSVVHSLPAAAGGGAAPLPGAARGPHAAGPGPGSASLAYGSSGGSGGSGGGLSSFAAAFGGVGGGGAHGAGLTHQQRQQQDAAKLAANRAMLADRIRQRGGLPAPNLNRTRAWSPPRQLAGGGGGSSGASSGAGCGGSGADNNSVLPTAAAAPGARRRGASGGSRAGAGAGGSTSASRGRGQDAKRFKLLSGLGVAKRQSEVQQPGGAAGAAPAGRGAGAAAAAGGKENGGGGSSARRQAADAGGGAAAQFRAAFGAVAQNAATVADAGESAQLKALAAAQYAADVDKLFAHYEKKDALAQQLEGMTKIKVTAFHCRTCNCITEKRHPGCAGHAVERVRATKRWWSCRACGWRLATLNTAVPTKRCPKCRDPAAEFDAATAFVAPKEVASESLALAAGVAQREAFLPRGTEHEFALSSFK